MGEVGNGTGGNMPLSLEGKGGGEEKKGDCTTAPLLDPTPKQIVLNTPSNIYENK